MRSEILNNHIKIAYLVSQSNTCTLDQLIGLSSESRSQILSNYTNVTWLVDTHTLTFNQLIELNNTVRASILEHHTNVGYLVGQTQTCTISELAGLNNDTRERFLKDHMKIYSLVKKLGIAFEQIAALDTRALSTLLAMPFENRDSVRQYVENHLPEDYANRARGPSH